MEIMEGMKAKDVFLGILRLQYRYNTNVLQLFSDGGSQLNAKLLGHKRSYYQDQLNRLWGIHNNTPYSQHRNLVERKISNLKRLIKEGVFGVPGPQSIDQPIHRSILETTIEAAVSMLNNTPYLESGPNSLLLAPADFLTPWKGEQPKVQNLPEHGLRSLADARRSMIVRQEKLRELVT